MFYSIFMILWERQNCRDRKQISGYQGLREGEELILEQRNCYIWYWGDGYKSMHLQKPIKQYTLKS